MADERLTPQEASERAERLTAAGITVENPPPGRSVVTLLKGPTPRPAGDPLQDDDGSGAVECASRADATERLAANP